MSLALPSFTSGQHLGGTLRARPPEETLQKIQPLIKKAGITRIAHLTHLDCIGIPVYSCIRPLSKNLSTSQGKGISHPLAMCSAYMEAIECFFAEQVPTDYRISSSIKKSLLPFAEIDLSTLQPLSLIHI